MRRREGGRLERREGESRKRKRKKVILINDKKMEKVKMKETAGGRRVKKGREAG